MSLEQQSREYWNKKAPEWVDQKPLAELASAVQHYVKNYVNDILPTIPDNFPILDLGTGSGTNKYFDESIISRVIGLDISDEMLRLNIIEKKVNSVMNKTLPIKDNSIGLITSIFTMRYQSRIDHIKMFDEFARVLVPGGRILLIDANNNNYDLQLSTFDVDQYAEICHAYGYTLINTQKDKTFSTGGYHDGWGNTYGEQRGYINVFCATKPIDFKPRDLSDQQIFKYVNPVGYEADIIRVREMRHGGF